MVFEILSTDSCMVGHHDLFLESPWSLKRIKVQLPCCEYELTAFFLSFCSSACFVLLMAQVMEALTAHCPSHGPGYGSIDCTLSSSHRCGDLILLTTVCPHVCHT